VSGIVEDLEGRLYVGTGRGVDRLDPDSGRVRHYSERDGFWQSEVMSALLDRRTGHLWFAQQSGVSRLILPADPAPLAPPILITHLEIAGRKETINPLGETVPPALRLEPNRNNLRIEYVALGFAPGEDLHYQYRLEGAQSGWSAPSTQRTVNFANLAAGRYRFLVRAISADGLTSPEPARVEFTILPPVWQRAWFIALAAVALASLLYGAYRYRLRRALELAAVRARIASDLHDDVGANLTKIAVLSEVARQHLDGQGGAGDRLSAIARISRESVSSMSDAVWSINPRRDNLRDTIRRMRQHAEELLAGTGIVLMFHAPESERNFRVPIEIRRDVFLIFKEALNNAVRHSNCRAITIDVGTDGSNLRLRLDDDGAGFDVQTDPAGNGLASMHRRANEMNASLDVVSAPGAGTSVRLDVPGASVTGLRWPA
jgi:signal transduction histidine kinase